MCDGGDPAGLTSPTNPAAAPNPGFPRSGAFTTKLVPYIAGVKGVAVSHPRHVAGYYRSGYHPPHNVERGWLAGASRA